MTTNSKNLENSLGSSRSPINLTSNTLQQNLDSLLNGKNQQQYEKQQQDILTKELNLSNENKQKPEEDLKQSELKIQQPVDDIKIDMNYSEKPFMPKMANETLKAELGRSSWKLFHTILARYPDKPTQQEKTTLAQYLQLFAKVYPCGDCARHFQKLLISYPPQTNSRKVAALWGCDIHNKVNKRLNKPEYDCTTILEDYDCGCGSDELEVDSTLGVGSKGESIDHLRNLKVDKEDKQRGG
ncbi:hypothetical protein KGF54_005521 [Candida jiufengensis]|uniref:uncharacterized protein n=1 Tax=Candida jiufengensis TaxID=497108 RepID=UPI0022245A10|nr:uncharacterized protein KGF54_005521 [Candida jiufengensis]KAI5949286.1 hypothetical protein KGF54_005521 [Candida jiufengensis]